MMCTVVRKAPIQASPNEIGSGFILTSDGYILTSAHLVEGATHVTVMLSNRRKFKAKVIVRDSRSDTALLKIARPPCSKFRRSGAAETRTTGRGRELAVRVRKFDNPNDRLSNAAFVPGERLRSIHPDQLSDKCARMSRKRPTNFRDPS